jgi:very-short-patch-repair endonuclease
MAQMTDRKTLQLRDPSETADAAPAIKKKGRGWEISDKRLDALHDRAREMRRHSSPAHKALAERFAKADLGRYKFTRHAVIGSAIVDFGCPLLGMAVSIDEPDVDPAIAQRRDKSLNAVGIRVMRVKAGDVLEDMDAVLARITAGMKMRMADKKAKAREHAAANPRQDWSRPRNGSDQGRNSR